MKELWLRKGEDRRLRAGHLWVFGNEVDGVRQDVIDAADATLEIPQFGSKHSLNVAVSAGVVLWHMTFCHWHGH